MNIRKIFRLFSIGITLMLLISCSDMFRSAFQNELIEKCNAEGKGSKARCECLAEEIDADFSQSDKQLMLNPSDNPFMLFKLVTPLLEINEKCKSKGR